MELNFNWLRALALSLSDGDAGWVGGLKLSCHLLHLRLKHDCGTFNPNITKKITFCFSVTADKSWISSDLFPSSTSRKSSTTRFSSSESLSDKLFGLGSKYSTLWIFIACYFYLVLFSAVHFCVSESLIFCSSQLQFGKSCKSFFLSFWQHEEKIISICESQKILCLSGWIRPLSIKKSQSLLETE